MTGLSNSHDRPFNKLSTSRTGDRPLGSPLWLGKNEPPSRTGFDSRRLHQCNKLDRRICSGPDRGPPDLGLLRRQADGPCQPPEREGRLFRALGEEVVQAFRLVTRKAIQARGGGVEAWSFTTSMLWSCGLNQSSRASRSQDRGGGCAGSFSTAELATRPGEGEGEVLVHFDEAHWAAAVRALDGVDVKDSLTQRGLCQARKLAEPKFLGRGVRWSEELRLCSRCSSARGMARRMDPGAGIRIRDEESGNPVLMNGGSDQRWQACSEILRQPLALLRQGGSCFRFSSQASGTTRRLVP